MGSEWPTVALGELSNITSSKRIFASDYCTSGVPFYRSKEIIEKANGRSVSTELFISRDKFSGIKQKFGAPEENDILLTSVGTLGVPYLVKAKEEFYFKDGNLTWLQTSTAEVCARFIYIWLRSSVAKRGIDEVTIGSTQQALTIVALKSLKISLPPLPEQHAIAHILGSLDDKIELNRQMNATLEGMAQALFKSWFVDFDPVIDNALAAGNPIPEELADRAEVRRAALADGTANREAAKPFPAGFQHTEELGWIPEGWLIRGIEDVADVRSGKRIPKGHTLVGEMTPYPYLRGVDVNNGRFGRTDVKYLNEATQSKIAKYIVNTNDVVLTIVGTIGRVIYIDSEWDGANLTENAARLTNFHGIGSRHVFQYLSSEGGQKDIESRIAGSVQGKLPLYQIKAMLLAIPDQPVSDAFEVIAASLDEVLVHNLNGSETLTAIRDTLLPKLISGELRIPDAEKLAEEALA